MLFSGLFHSVKAASVDEVRSLLEQHDPNIAFIDVRRGDEWNAGHIDGFQHIPLDSLPVHMNELKSYGKVYFLCHSGGRSTRACHMIEKAGYEEAYNVKGGIAGWIAKKFPVTRTV